MLWLAVAYELADASRMVPELHESGVRLEYMPARDGGTLVALPG